MNLQRLPEALIAEMRHIEDHAQPVHLLNQFFATGGQGPRRVMT
jgi:hypothetical protein